MLQEIKDGLNSSTAWIAHFLSISKVKAVFPIDQCKHPSLVNTTLAKFCESPRGLCYCEEAPFLFSPIWHTSGAAEGNLHWTTTYAGGQSRWVWESTLVYQCMNIPNLLEGLTFYVCLRTFYPLAEVLWRCSGLQQNVQSPE